MPQGQVDQAAERERLIDDARQKAGAARRRRGEVAQRTHRALEAALAEANQRADNLNEHAASARARRQGRDRAACRIRTPRPRGDAAGQQGRARGQDLEKSLSELKSRMGETLAAAASKVCPTTLRDRDQEIERLARSCTTPSRSPAMPAAMARTLAARDREIAELRQQMSEAGGQTGARPIPKPSKSATAPSPCALCAWRAAGGGWRPPRHR